MVYFIGESPGGHEKTADIIVRIMQDNGIDVYGLLVHRSVTNATNAANAANADIECQRDVAYDREFLENTKRLMDDYNVVIAIINKKYMYNLFGRSYLKITW